MSPRYFFDLADRKHVLIPTQKQMIVRFRERWAQLKESMKRKKEAKAAAAAASSPVREKIVEDPQGEGAEEPPW